MLKALGVAALAALVNGGALAADAGLPPAPASVPYVPAQAPRVFSWTGLYAGINAGYGFADATVSADGLSFGERLTGAVAGGQLGFNWQMPGSGFVAGLEADLQWSNQQVQVQIPAFSETDTDKITFFGTLRPRVGYAYGRTLYFASAGIGYGTFRSEVSQPGFDSWGSTSRLTWAFSVGVEAALTDYVTLRAEYLVLDTGNISNSSAFSAGIVDSIARVGVNFLLPVGH